MLALAVVVVAFGCWAAPAGAYIYWADATVSAIGRADLDGSGATAAFLPTSAPTGVAVDGQNIYWGNTLSDSIGRANLDGSDANPTFISGAEFPGAVAVDGQHIYWTTAGTIARAKLDGTGVNLNFIPIITDASASQGIAVDGQHIYWVNNGNNTIGRANLDGSDPDQNFITGARDAAGLAVDGQHVYWPNDGGDTIGRANLDGSGVDQDFIANTNSPAGIAVDAQHVYWGVNQTTIARANLDGTDVNQSFVPHRTGFGGIAVDSGPPGTATPSAASLTFPAQLVSTFGPPQAVTVTNTGHGILAVDQAQITGDGIGDFLISADTCSGAALQVDATCTIDVRFGPSTGGARSGLLTVTSDDPAGPLQIPLSGAGSSPPSGASGAPGSAGATGTVGPPGPPGANGPAGNKGSNGRVQIVTCRQVTRTVVRKVRGTDRRVKVKRQRCRTRIVSKPVTFRARSVRRATLTRGGVVFARGTELHAGGHPELLLHPTRNLNAGHYVLRVTWTDCRHHRHTTRQDVTVTSREDSR
jgi:virginiamycin B lyase